MHTAKHDPFVCRVGESVQITYNVTDKDGNPVSVAGANGNYKVSRELGDTALLTKTVGAGLSLSGTQAVVSFLVSEIVETIDEEDVQIIGLVKDQLRIIKDGDDLVVANGSFTIEDVIR